MFQELPPEHLFNPPGRQPPYCWKGRLLVAAYEVAEHVLQFWARVVHLCPLLEADRPVHLQAVRV